MEKNVLLKLIDPTKTTIDSNGIYVTNKILSTEASASKKVWENIYSYSLKTLIKDLQEFTKDKLNDHLFYIDNCYSFNPSTIYLEIGCGPAYIGNYLAANTNCYFVGIDINYPMLITLKEYFDSVGFDKYILIHGDIFNIPIKDSTVDFIYGGGVIEHISNTVEVLKESHRILKPSGISFNTVPAMNMWWFLRFFRNIPDLPVLRQVFEYIHIKLLHNIILNKFYGYELSFTINKLRKIHLESGFSKIKITPFAFHPSTNKLRNRILRNLYFYFQKNSLTTAIYLVCARK